MWNVALACVYVSLFYFKSRFFCNSPGKEDDDDGDEVHTVRGVGSPPPGPSAREDHGSDELAPAQFHSEVSR